ncbi:MAG: insulinase family protein, partial [Bacteroidota bacterium]
SEDLKKEFFKLGLSFDVSTGRDRLYVYLSGLESNLEEGLELFEHYLSDVQPDPEAYNDLVDGILKERADAKLSKFAILNQAMREYARYGADNPVRDIISEEELRAMDVNALVDKLKSITSYKHRVFYYGQKDPQAVKQVIEASHKVPETLADYPAPKTFATVDMDQNKVYFVDYDMVQTEMLMVSKVGTFDPGVIAQANIFNEYFGSGLSSIVFQEIREAKALAYSAYSVFTTPGKKEDPHYVQAYIGTQTDKLNDATDAMLNLMNNMPEANAQFEDARLAALKRIETNRITRTSIFWSHETAKRRGLDHDLRKDTYPAIEGMQMADLKGFFDQYIKGRNYTFLVIGKKSDVDFDALAKLGSVEELSLEQVFGY